MNNYNQRGAVLLLYVIIVSFLVLLMIFGSQSRSILTIRRNQSSIDSLTTLYKSESVANDYLARLVAGYVEPPFSEDFEEDGFDVEVDGFYDSEGQVIRVTSKKKFAVGSVEARRKNLLQGNYTHADIILSLDCTGSMNAGADCKDCSKLPSRFDAQEAAAVKFIDDLIGLGYESSQYSLGVQVFGGDAKWLQSNGIDIKPSSNISFQEIKSVIQDGFGTTRDESNACDGIIDVTSIGSALSSSQSYFATNKRPGTRQIDIVISDGLPNSRIPDEKCSPNVFCPAFPLNPDGSINYCTNNDYGWECHDGEEYVDGPYGRDNYNRKAFNTCEPLGIDYAACRLADTNTKTKETGNFGVRDPEVEAYVVIVYDNAPKRLVNMFRNYVGSDRFYNPDEADQLSGILRVIFEQITKDKSLISVKKIVLDDE